jgi:hypothetical protein
MVAFFPSILLQMVLEDNEAAFAKPVVTTGLATQQIF